MLYHLTAQYVYLSPAYSVTTFVLSGVRTFLRFNFAVDFIRGCLQHGVGIAAAHGLQPHTVKFGLLNMRGSSGLCDKFMLLLYLAPFLVGW